MIGAEHTDAANSNDEANFPSIFLLIDRQVSKYCKIFAINS